MNSLDISLRTASGLGWKWAPFPKPPEVHQMIKTMERMGLNVGLPEVETDFVVKIKKNSGRTKITIGGRIVLDGLYVEVIGLLTSLAPTTSSMVPPLTRILLDSLYDLKSGGEKVKGRIPGGAAWLEEIKDLGLEHKLVGGPPDPVKMERKEYGKLYSLWDVQPGIWVKTPFNRRVGGVMEGWVYGKGTKNVYFYVMFVHGFDQLPYMKYRRWSYNANQLVRMDPPSNINFEKDIPPELLTHKEGKAKKAQSVREKKVFLNAAYRSGGYVWVARSAHHALKAKVVDVRNTRVVLTLDVLFSKARSAYPPGTRIIFQIMSTFATEAEAKASKTS